MAKKISFSLRNEEIDEMEKLSKSSGKKVIEIIRERYESGKKTSFLNKNIDLILNEISKLKTENEEKFLKIFSIFEVIIRQNTFSNDVLLGIVRGNKNEEEVKLYEDLVDKKCEEKLSKLRKIFFER